VRVLIAVERLRQLEPLEAVEPVDGPAGRLDGQVEEPAWSRREGCEERGVKRGV